MTKLDSKMIELMVKAHKIANNAHQGQTDKSGITYMHHVLTVAFCFESTDLRYIVALLHDVVEDSDWTFDALLLNGIPFEVVEAVDAITKRKNEIYIDYLQRVAANPLAKDVKLADLKHNSDLSRLPNPTQKDFERRGKYKMAIEYLSKVF